MSPVRPAFLEGEAGGEGPPRSFAKNRAGRARPSRPRGCALIHRLTSRKTAPPGSRGNPQPTPQSRGTGAGWGAAHTRSGAQRLQSGAVGCEGPPRAAEPAQLRSHRPSARTPKRWPVRSKSFPDPVSLLDTEPGQVTGVLRDGGDLWPDPPRVRGAAPISRLRSSGHRPIWKAVPLPGGSG